MKGTKITSITKLQKKFKQQKNNTKVIYNKKLNFNVLIIATIIFNNQYKFIQKLK
jgi:hypothetical protein